MVYWTYGGGGRCVRNWKRMTDNVCCGVSGSGVGSGAAAATRNARMRRKGISSITRSAGRMLCGSCSLNLTFQASGVRKPRGLPLGSAAVAHDERLASVDFRVKVGVEVLGRRPVDVAVCASRRARLQIGKLRRLGEDVEGVGEFLCLVHRSSIAAPSAAENVIATLRRFRATSRRLPESRMRGARPYFGSI